MGDKMTRKAGPPCTQAQPGEAPVLNKGWGCFSFQHAPTPQAARPLPARPPEHADLQARAALPRRCKQEWAGVAGVTRCCPHGHREARFPAQPAGPCVAAVARRWCQQRRRVQERRRVPLRPRALLPAMA